MNPERINKRRAVVAGIMASVLGVAGLTPPTPSASESIRQASGTPSNASIRAVGQTQARQDRAIPTSSARATGPLLGLIGGMGDGPLPMYGGRGGMSPYEWGTSRYCRNMVLKNKRKGRTGRKGMRG